MRTVTSLLLSAALPVLVGCSTPDATTPAARDVSDERAAVPSGEASPNEKNDRSTPEGHPMSLAERLRALDKTVYAVNVDGLPAIGPAAAPLTIVLFGDYECMFSRRLETQLAQLRADHGSDVRIVLAPRPLPAHVRARPAALAAIAAAEQGRLEPMHRALVALDGRLDEDSIKGAAREAGLDLVRFEADRKSAKVERILSRADDLAKRFAVTATPTTFVNGRRVTGAVPEVIRRLGEEQLELGRGLVRAGTPPARVYETLVASGLESASPDASIRRIGAVGPEKVREAALERISDVTKCWAGPDAAPAKSIELTIGGDGKVARAETEPAEHAACVTRAVSAWTFDQTERDSKLRLVFHP